MNFTTQNSTLPYLSLVREKVKVKICTSVTLLGVATLLTGLTPNVQALPAQTLITQVNTEDVFQQGLDKIDAGDYEAAVEILTKVLEQNPNDAEAYYNRGLAYAELEEDKKAVEDLQKSAELFRKQGKSAESQQALALIKKLQP